MAQTTRTTDHAEIKEWVEARSGSPAVIEGTRDEFGSGILRVDFDDADEALEELSWEDFFRLFDENELAFVYEETADAVGGGGVYKFISRLEESDEDVIDEF